MLTLLLPCPLAVRSRAALARVTRPDLACLRLMAVDFKFDEKITRVIAVYFSHVEYGWQQLRLILDDLIVLVT